MSVIIPVYNGQAFVRQCVESVQDQTWKDLEIILVDDGSGDRSLDICRQMEAGDRRIRVVSQDNRGVSAARNRGLSQARGEYIFFLDSDDMICPLLLETFVRQAQEQKAEVLFCSWTRRSPGEGGAGWESEERTFERDGRRKKGKHRRGPDRRTEKRIRKPWTEGTEEEAEEWFHKRYHRELSGIGGKMIDGRLMRDTGFDEAISGGEDTLFMYNLVRRGAKMAYLDRQWYYYREHDGSLSCLNRTVRERHCFKAYERIRDQEYERGSRWAAEWEYRFVWDILTRYLIMCEQRDLAGIRDLRERMLKEMRHPLYRAFPVGRKALFGGLFLGCSWIPPVRQMWMRKRRRPD